MSGGNKVRIEFICDLGWLQQQAYLFPPLKKEGHIALHMSVGMSVGRLVGMSVAFNLVQLIAQERFAPEASNLVGR